MASNFGYASTKESWRRAHAVVCPAMHRQIQAEYDLAAALRASELDPAEAAAFEAEVAAFPQEEAAP